jgi:hypothetical protein
LTFFLYNINLVLRNFNAHVGKARLAITLTHENKHSIWHAWKEN